MENFLKNFRAAKGITQKQISTLCGISERQYIRYENNDQEPAVRTAIRIARVLDTTVEELFPTEGDDEHL